MKVDSGREWINRNVTHPVVSYDWGEDFETMIRRNGRPNGLIGEWRKVRERIARRRSPHPVGSIMWKACENAIGALRCINAMGEAGKLGEPGDWVPSHTILDRVATEFERRTGRIDPLVQAILREAMDETYLSERFER